MKKLVKLSFALAMILSLGIMAQSCKTSKQSSKNDYPGENTPNITGTWVLKSLNGQPTASIFKGKTPTMNIDVVEKRIFGNGGCNGYTGSFTYEKGILSAPNLASTMMMCPDENQEHQFHQVLGQPNKVSIRDGVLLQLSNNGKVVAEFEKGIDTSLLIGEWKLETIADGDVATLFADNIPTISFDLAESRFGGNAGCNRYNATYKIEGTAITVGPVMSTRMACPNMEGEGKFTQIITGTSTIEAGLNKITFSKDGKVILTFVKDVK
ncbi:META domain-containing protein [Dysgonomonas sp. HGC4]|uniref:META domain-containing protein n=1 Tax=Dysgonomonas sp. HGC4 TaxID=1658009 RepID=UPI0006812329|nr:META domain-containing protein [Dysgonomonas sp. HGC4]MBD8346996.1 META domain-containing protein [Dysgonomonas sp. HGC4]